MINKLRNNTIDILRTIGLLLVMASHCCTTQIFFQFREFDVVLLMFVSGASFMISSKEEKYIPYCIKRFKRLVLPAWLFLIIYMPIRYFVFHHDFTLKYVIGSFLLTNGGLGFVWIFRVMFITALCNPFMKKISGKKYSLLLGLVIIILDDLIIQYLDTKFSSAVLFAGITVLSFYKYIIAFTITYAVISLYGMKIYSLPKKQQLIISLISLCIFLGYGYLNGFPSLQEYKYPPMLYYVSYGMFWSTLLYVLFDSIHFNEKVNNVFAWISKHTMSIYIWHIVFYYLVSDKVVTVFSWGIPMFLFVLTCSILMAYIQDKIISTYRKKKTC